MLLKQRNCRRAFLWVRPRGNTKKQPVRFASVRIVLTGQQPGVPEVRRDEGYLENERRKHKEVIEWVGRDIGIVRMEDWYKAQTTLSTKTGHGLRNILGEWYQGNLSIAVMSIWPEHNWEPWKFERLPASWWNTQSHQVQFLDWCASQVGFDPKDLSKWYSIPSSRVVSLGGGGAVEKFRGSTYRLLSSAYPSHRWEWWKFTTVVKGMWSDINRQREYLEMLGEQLGYQQRSDWYKLSHATIVSHGGRGLMTFYRHNVYKCLCAVYPEHTWWPWLFERVPHGFWEDTQHHRQYFDWLAEELKLPNKADAWYSVTMVDIDRTGGGGLVMRYYRDSLPTALMAVYPESNLKPWRFVQTPKLFWENVFRTGKQHVVVEYLDELGKNLHVNELDDWYRVSHQQLRSAGSKSVVELFGGLQQILRFAFPEHEWQKSKFQQGAGKKSEQRHLVNTIKALFPGVALEEEFGFNLSSPRASNTKQQFQLDVYVQSLNLGFEAQGEQHYKEVGLFGATNSQHDVDSTKSAFCSREGITLISVPYWWDGSITSLANTIRMARPDLIKEKHGDGHVIPNEAPGNTTRS